MASRSGTPLSIRFTARSAAGRMPEGAAAAGVAGREPGAGLLGADRHDGDVPRRGEAGPLHAGDRGEPGQHPGRAVEIAALRHAVEVAAEDDALRRAVGPRQGQEEVADRVGLALQPDRLCRFLDQGMRHALPRPIGLAGDADPVEAAGLELREQLFREFDIGRQIGQHLWSPGGAGQSKTRAAGGRPLARPSPARGRHRPGSCCR